MTETALLVHGLSSDSNSWWWLRDELEQRGYAVTAPDLRGHGTAARAESYSLSDYASDLPSAPGDEPWGLVVGHSLGAAASVLAAQRPGFTRALVLLDPVLEVAPEHHDSILADQLSELELTADSIRQLKPHWREADREAKLRGIQATDSHVVEHTFADSGRWDVRSEAAALTVPTLVLAGDPEVYTMLEPDTRDALTAANPRVHVVAVPGAGHSPHRDVPLTTLLLLEDWLARR